MCINNVGCPIFLSLPLMVTRLRSSLTVKQEVGKHTLWLEMKINLLNKIITLKIQMG